MISVSWEVGFIGLYKVGKMWGVARIVICMTVYTKSNSETDL